MHPYYNSGMIIAQYSDIMAAIFEYIIISITTQLPISMYYTLRT